MIENHLYYNREMKKSLQDKLFFINDWDIDNMPEEWIDIGCADGQVIKALSDLYEKFDKKGKFLGIDNDPEQEILFKTNFPNGHFYFDLMPAFVSTFVNKNLTKGVILSSVLHESPILLNKAIVTFNPDHIVIRDMALSKEHRHFGPRIERLVKARFGEGPNAEHELAESYFQLTVEDFEEAPTGYETVWFEHKPLPWLVDNVFPPIYKDIPTHMYAIYRKK